jgi:hypothetical protein
MEDFVIPILIVLTIIGLGIKGANKYASENPKAKEIGLTMLSRWLK